MTTPRPATAVYRKGPLTHRVEGTMRFGQRFVGKTVVESWQSFTPSPGEALQLSGYQLSHYEFPETDYYVFDTEAVLTQWLSKLTEAEDKALWRCAGYVADGNGQPLSCVAEATYPVHVYKFAQ